MTENSNVSPGRTSKGGRPSMTVATSKWCETFEAGLEELQSEARRHHTVANETTPRRTSRVLRRSSGRIAGPADNSFVLLDISPCDANRDAASVLDVAAPRERLSSCSSPPFGHINPPPAAGASATGTEGSESGRLSMAGCNIQPGRRTLRRVQITEAVEKISPGRRSFAPEQTRPRASILKRGDAEGPRAHSPQDVPARRSHCAEAPARPAQCRAVPPQRQPTVLGVRDAGTSPTRRSMVLDFTPAPASPCAEAETPLCEPPSEASVRRAPAQSNTSDSSRLPKARSPPAGVKKSLAMRAAMKRDRARRAGRGVAPVVVAPKQETSTPVRPSLVREVPTRANTSPDTRILPDANLVEAFDDVSDEKRPKAWVVKFDAPKPVVPEVPLGEARSRLARLREARSNPSSTQLLAGVAKPARAGKATVHAPSREALRTRAPPTPQRQSLGLRTAAAVTAELTPRRAQQLPLAARSTPRGQSPTGRPTARTRAFNEVLERFRDFTPHLLTAETLGTFLEQQGEVPAGLSRLQRIQKAEEVLAAAGLI